MKKGTGIQQRCGGSARLRNRELLDRIRRVHEENFGVYGVRKGRGSYAVKESRPPGRACLLETSSSATSQASAPNRLWVADFTHVATWSGVCYVAFASDFRLRLG